MTFEELKLRVERQWADLEPYYQEKVRAQRQALLKTGISIQVVEAIDAALESFARQNANKVRHIRAEVTLDLYAQLHTKLSVSINQVDDCWTSRPMVRLRSQAFGGAYFVM